MSSAAYSDLKAAWHLDKIRELRRGDQITPIHVQLILSDLCNQDCHFCAYRMSAGFSTEQFAGPNGEKNPNRRIATAKALEIIKDCSILGVQAIQFTGGGEPTVHPDHLHIFEEAQRLGISTALVTNGVLFRPGWELTLPKMKWVRVSIDAGSPAEYATVRRTRPESYTKALANVSDLRLEIERQGTDCYLGCGYVITKENWKSLVKGVEYIRDAGAHNVRLSAMFSTDGPEYYADCIEDIRKVIAEAKSMETQGFSVIDLFGNRIDDLVQHAPDYEFCGYQQFNMYIGGNLKVYRCCTTAYTLHGEVGDLTNQRFATWFYSLGKRAAYSSFNARTCRTCQFNSKNRAINYLRDGDPLHVDFV